jgi:CRISPR system Cascade subunit CasB
MSDMNSPGPVSTENHQSRKRFVTGLYALGRDLDSGDPHRVAKARRVLARVRRSLNDPHYLPDVLGLVLPHSPSREEKEVWIFIAALFSLNPRSASNGWRKPLGVALRDCGTDTSSEARLRQLLTSDWNTLQNRLRQAVRLLQQKKVSLDYGRLLDDLVELHQAPAGSARAHRVHLRWAEHFQTGWADPQE